MSNTLLGLGHRRRTLSNTLAALRSPWQMCLLCVKASRRFERAHLEQHVVRVEVTVADALAVNVLHTFHDASQDANEGEPAALQSPRCHVATGKQLTQAPTVAELLYRGTGEVWQTLNTGKSPRHSEQSHHFWSCTWSNLRALFRGGLSNITGATVRVSGLCVPTTARASWMRAERQHTPCSFWGQTPKKCGHFQGRRTWMR